VLLPGCTPAAREINRLSPALTACTPAAAAESARRVRTAIPLHSSSSVCNFNSLSPHQNNNIIYMCAHARIILSYPIQTSKCNSAERDQKKLTCDSLGIRCLNSCTRGIFPCGNNRKSVGVFFCPWGFLVSRI
jgi:hypothetical protein